MRTKLLTFDNLIILEPDLLVLFLAAKRYPRVKGEYCPVNTWYREFKPVLIHLVGWCAQSDNPILHSKQAYDLAYETVDHALPRCPKGCRGCGN